MSEREIKERIMQLVEEIKLHVRVDRRALLRPHRALFDGNPEQQARALAQALDSPRRWLLVLLDDLESMPW